MSGVRLPRPERIADLARRLGGVVDAGANDAVIERIREPAQDATDRELVVLVSRGRVPAVQETAATVLCDAQLAPLVVEGRRWAHPHVWWVVQQIVGAADHAQSLGQGIISRGAHVHPSARVSAGAIIEDGVEIGANCVIGHHVVIHGNVVIGERVEIGASSVVGAPGFGWAHDPAGRTIRVPQLGGVRIEDDVCIGCLCTVDAGTLGPTILRRGARLDAHVHVGHNVEIGAETHVAAQAGFGGSSRIGTGVRVGGQAGVSDHVAVGDGVRVAAKSGVIGDVRAGATVAGFPAVDRIRWLRAMAKLMGRQTR